MGLNLKVLIFQISLVAAYFPIYYFLGVWYALALAFISCILDLFSWPGALRFHLQDERFVYLIGTVSTSFIGLILLFANLYEVVGSVVVSESQQAISGLWNYIYFSVVTFTTLGYGDYSPQGWARLPAAIQAIFGLGYFALMIGVSSSVFYNKIQKK